MRKRGRGTHGSSAGGDHYAIQLVDRDEQRHRAHVTLELLRSRETPSAEVLGDRRLCRITLKWNGGEIVGRAWDFFTAFCQVREQLEPQGVLPVCYAASRNVILRPIEQDMGAGMIIHKAELNQPLHKAVRLFESGPDVEPVTVQEQRAFHEQYYRESWSLMRSLLGW